jgi:hypothetical protein
MCYILLMLLLLVPSFALIMLIALATGFYCLDPPIGVAATGLVYPYFGIVVAIVMMLHAGWLCSAGGGMTWTRLSGPVFFVAWFLLMMAMMKVGLHSLELWADQSVAVSPIALLMGGLVAPLSCQGLLLVCTFLNEDQLQPGNRWYTRTVGALAAAMAVSLAIGATTLLTEIPKRPVQLELGSKCPDEPGHGAPMLPADFQHFALSAEPADAMDSR